MRQIHYMSVSLMVELQHIRHDTRVIPAFNVLYFHVSLTIVAQNNLVTISCTVYQANKVIHLEITVSKTILLSVSKN